MQLLFTKVDNPDDIIERIKQREEATDDIELELQSDVEVYSELNEHQPINLNYHKNNDLLTWSFIKGAENYEIEYVYLPVCVIL